MLHKTKTENELKHRLLIVYMLKSQHASLSKFWLLPASTFH